MLAASMRIMASSSVNMQPFKNPIRSTSIMSSMGGRRKSSVNIPPDTNSSKNNGGVSSSGGSQPPASPPSSILTPASANGKIENIKEEPPSPTETNGLLPKISNSSANQEDKNCLMTPEVTRATTVLLQPESHCRVRTANHVTYSIDSKPKHLVKGSPLWKTCVPNSARPSQEFSRYGSDCSYSQMKSLWTYL